jgi:hypothetical protein
MQQILTVSYWVKSDFQVAAESAAKALAAAATGTNAFRSIFSETTFRNALGETLIGTIDAELSSQKQSIYKKLLLECVDSYPVEIALSEVQNYKDTGSFYNGLALVRRAAEQNIASKIQVVGKKSNDSPVTAIPGAATEASVATGQKISPSEEQTGAKVDAQSEQKK